MNWALGTPKERAIVRRGRAGVVVDRWPSVLTATGQHCPVLPRIAHGPPPGPPRRDLHLDRPQARIQSGNLFGASAYGVTAGIEVKADAGLKLSPRTLTCPLAGSPNSTVPRRFRRHRIIGCQNESGVAECRQ